MLIGTIVCMVAMLLLGFTRPVASIFTGWHTSAVCFHSVIRYCFLKNIPERHFDHIVGRSVNLPNRLCYQCW